MANLTIHDILRPGVHRLMVISPNTYVWVTKGVSAQNIIIINSKFFRTLEISLSLHLSAKYVWIKSLSWLSHFIKNPRLWPHSPYAHCVFHWKSFSGLRTPASRLRLCGSVYFCYQHRFLPLTQTSHFYRNPGMKRSSHPSNPASCSAEYPSYLWISSTYQMYTHNQWRSDIFRCTPPSESRIVDIWSHVNIIPENSRVPAGYHLCMFWDPHIFLDNS